MRTLWTWDVKISPAKRFRYARPAPLREREPDRRPTLRSPLCGEGVRAADGWGWFGWVSAWSSRRIPSPVWERGRGEGVRVQGEAPRSPLTTVCALRGEGLPSPLTPLPHGRGGRALPASRVLRRSRSFDPSTPPGASRSPSPQAGGERGRSSAPWILFLCAGCPLLRARL